jgi:hypothetical protein
VIVDAGCHFKWRRLSLRINLAEALGRPRLSKS